MTEQPELIGTTQMYKGRVFSVRIDTVQIGDKQHRLDIVAHPGSFAIAAMPEPGSIVLVRQYRHAAGRALWEIPAGTAEPDEDPLAGARRELREETGYAAQDWQLLCSVYPTPGYCTELVHVYRASNLRSGPQELDEDEAIDVRTFTMSQAWSMQASGEIVDMKSLLALLWLRNDATN